jgi:hypothetical protein
VVSQTATYALDVALSPQRLDLAMARKWHAGAEGLLEWPVAGILKSVHTLK